MSPDSILKRHVFKLCVIHCMWARRVDYNLISGVEYFYPKICLNFFFLYNWINNVILSVRKNKGKNAHYISICVYITSRKEIYSVVYIKLIYHSFFFMITKNCEAQLIVMGKVENWQHMSFSCLNWDIYLEVEFALKVTSC